MRDVISIHIGQAGVQIGSSVWELFCVEHQLDEQGFPVFEKTKEIENSETFFIRTNKEKNTPRSLFIDLEPTVMDEVRMGSYRNLFHADRLISGPEDASSNFARGFFTIGKLLLDRINREMRKLFEASTSVQGFLIFRSLGGGTGAGLTSTIFDGLSEFPKSPKIEIPIYPSPTLSASTVEPYNSIIAEHFCMEDVDVGLLFDNEAMYEICTKYLNIHMPTFANINRLLSQVCASITASIRFSSLLNCDLTVLTTNLVPYPRIHFPLCNFAPILPQAKADNEKLTIQDITHAVFDRENQMIKIDTTYGRYMSCALFYRGPVSPKQIYSALIEMKRIKTIEFVDWCPTGFKVGISDSCPITIPSSFIAPTDTNVAMLTNSSAIGQAWQRLCHKFYLLYSKRSFLHWFVGEGMDECEFTEALYNMSTLVKDYEEVTLDTPKSPEENSENKEKAMSEEKNDETLNALDNNQNNNSEPKICHSQITGTDKENSNICQCTKCVWSKSSFI